MNTQNPFSFLDSVAIHDGVCEAYRPTCPLGLSPCRLSSASGSDSSAPGTNSLQDWPHWRSPNVGLVSFHQIGLYINEAYALYAMGNAMGYSFGAVSDEAPENAQVCLILVLSFTEGELTLGR